MIIGNQEARQHLQKYMTQNSDSIWSKTGFFLLYGPANVGKHSFALEYSKEYLWDFFHNWFLHIQDFSDILWKKHSIRVAAKPAEEAYKTLLNQYEYTDLWVREIIFWLQQTSFGWGKVLLIENIERMTLSATNAFLKASEELLPQRLILATTSNKSQVLDTILSRAVSIPFFPLSEQEMLTYIEQQSFVISSPEVKDLLLQMAMWRPGVLNKFINQIQENSEIEKDLQTLLNILPKDGKIIEKFNILEKFYKIWILEQFVDAWIAYSTKHNIAQTYQRLKVKKMFQSNIKKENLILYSLLS